MHAYTLPLLRELVHFDLRLGLRFRLHVCVWGGGGGNWLHATPLQFLPLPESEARNGARLRLPPSDLPLRPVLIFLSKFATTEAPPGAGAGPRQQ